MLASWPAFEERWDCDSKTLVVPTMSNNRTISPRFRESTTPGCSTSDLLRIGLNSTSCNSQSPQNLNLEPASRFVSCQSTSLRCHHKQCRQPALGIERRDPEVQLG